MCDVGVHGVNISCHEFLAMIVKDVYTGILCSYPNVAIVVFTDGVDNGPLCLFECGKVPPFLVFERENPL